MTNNKKNNGGRPAGRRKTAKIEISIEPSVKGEFMNLMRVQGKTASVEIGLWIREYLSVIKKLNRKRDNVEGMSSFYITKIMIW